MSILKQSYNTPEYDHWSWYEIKNFTISDDTVISSKIQSFKNITSPHFFLRTILTMTRSWLVRAKKASASPVMHVPSNKSERSNKDESEERINILKDCCQDNHCKVGHSHRASVTDIQGSLVKNHVADHEVRCASLLRLCRQK